MQVDNAVDRLGKLVEDSIGPYRGTKTLQPPSSTSTSTPFSVPKFNIKGTGAGGEGEKGKNHNIELKLSIVAVTTTQKYFHIFVLRNDR